MSKHGDRKLRSNFFKNVALLASGTAITQLIQLAAIPVLTRLYSPDAFGQFAIYMSLSVLLALVSTGRLELAVVIPKSDSDAKNIINSIFLINLFVLLFSLLLGLAIYSTDVDIEFSFSVFFIAPLCVFAIGISQALTYWGIRKKQWHGLNHSRIYKSLTTVVTSIALGLSAFSSFGLEIGVILGYMVGVYFLFQACNRDEFHLNTIFDWSIFKDILNRYAHFPKVTLPSSLVESASREVVPIALALLHSTSVVGFLSLAQRVASAPTTLISSAIGEVFLNEASKSYQLYGSCNTVFIDTAKRLTAIGLPSFSLAYFLSPWFFEVAFGAEWRISGEYIQILVPMLFSQFIASPLSCLFMIAEQNKADFVLNFFVLISMLLLIFLSGVTNISIEIFLYIYSGIFSIKYFIQFYLSYLYSKGIKPSVDRNFA